MISSAGAAPTSDVTTPAVVEAPSSSRARQLGVAPISANISMSSRRVAERSSVEIITLLNQLKTTARRSYAVFPTAQPNKKAAFIQYLIVRFGENLEMKTQSIINSANPKGKSNPKERDCKRSKRSRTTADPLLFNTYCERFGED
jgi:hypothetical protein